MGVDRKPKTLMKFPPYIQTLRRHGGVFSKITALSHTEYGPLKVRVKILFWLTSNDS